MLFHLDLQKKLFLLVLVAGTIAGPHAMGQSIGTQQWYTYQQIDRISKKWGNRANVGNRSSIINEKLAYLLNARGGMP